MLDPTRETIIRFVARNTVTGKEIKVVVRKLPYLPREEMEQWVRGFYRNLELVEHWIMQPGETIGVVYPMPRDNVLFNVKPDERRPEPRRTSILFSDRLITSHGGSILIRGS